LKGERSDCWTTFRFDIGGRHQVAGFVFAGSYFLNRQTAEEVRSTEAKENQAEERPIQSCHGKGAFCWKSAFQHLIRIREENGIEERPVPEILSQA